MELVVTSLLIANIALVIAAIVYARMLFKATETNWKGAQLEILRTQKMVVELSCDVSQVQQKLWYCLWDHRQEIDIKQGEYAKHEEYEVAEQYQLAKQQIDEILQNNINQSDDDEDYESEF